jgi:hypothetical protein
VGKQTRTGIVPKRLFPIFRDWEELPTSSELGDVIGKALEDSSLLIVICSPRSAKYEIGEDGELSNRRTEPIAADAREGKDGKCNALLKRVDGLLGVGFDELKQRDLARKQKRLAY